MHDFFSTLYITAMPLTFAVTFFYGFLNWRAKKSTLAFYDGWLGWILYILGGMVGEFAGRFIYFSAYQPLLAKYGDSPGQIRGYIHTVLLSPFLCLMIYFVLRGRKRSPSF